MKLVNPPAGYYAPSPGGDFVTPIPKRQPPSPRSGGFSGGPVECPQFCTQAGCPGCGQPPIAGYTGSWADTTGSTVLVAPGNFKMGVPFDFVTGGMIAPDLEPVARVAGKDTSQATYTVTMMNAYTGRGPI